jgi:hypothetical protein
MNDKIEIGKRVYVMDPHRYPTGKVKLLSDTTVTLDTGTHEGLMPRYIDLPRDVVTTSLKEWKAALNQHDCELTCQT